MSSTKVKNSFKTLSIILMFAVCLALPFLLSVKFLSLGSANALGESAVVTVEVEDNVPSRGTYKAVAYDLDHKVIPFSSGATYENGTTVVIEPVPEEGYEFSCFDVGGQKVYHNLYTFVVNGSDVNVKVEFSNKKYELVFKTVDTSFNEIASPKIDATIKNVGMAGASLSSRYVALGDEIENVKYASGVNLENYTFVAWQIKNKGGQVESVSDDVVKTEIRNLNVTPDFLSKYALNGKVEIYGVFAQKSYLSLHLSVAADINELVSVYATIDDEVQKITDLSQPFEYGTVVTISANNQNNFVFTNFGGITEDDIYLAGQSTVRVVMNGNRAISVGFDYAKTPIKLETISNDKRVEVVFDKTEVYVGETLVISLAINEGYVLKDFTICDKSAKDFVRMLNQYGVSASLNNEEDAVEAATYDDRGVITIHVTDNIYNYFKSNPNMFVSATARPYGTYIALIVIYILLALGLGAVIITFSVLYQRQAVKVKTLKKQQEQELLARKEDEEKKLLKEEQELKKNTKNNTKPKATKTTAVKASKQDTEKAKIKQSAAKKASEKTKAAVKETKSNSQKKSTKEGK